MAAAVQVASIQTATSPTPQRPSLTTTPSNMSSTQQASSNPQQSSQGPPICHTCNQQITETQFIRVGAHKFHKDHFICIVCNVSLHGSKFHHKDGLFYCTRDYTNKYCHTCKHCNDKIVSGSVIQAFGSYYHPEHFVCKQCNQPFTDGKYYEYENEPYWYVYSC